MANVIQIKRGSGAPTTAKIGDHDGELAYDKTNHCLYINNSGTIEKIGAGSAATLSTARTISLSGAVTGTATSFNGSSNISIPVTEVKEKYLSWGGANKIGTVDPLSCAMSYLHSANRLQFAKPAGIDIEYSTDGGATWVDYGATDAQKVNFVSGIDTYLYLGKRTTDSTGTIDEKLRITVRAADAGVYTRLRTVLFDVSTDSSNRLTVLIESAKRMDETNFTSTVGTYTLAGSSGWNAIPIPGYNFGGSTTQTSHVGALRFTISYADTPTENQNAFILNTLFFGETYWTYPSEMARSGHLYKWDYQQNAIFPGTVTATKFIGPADSLSTARSLQVNLASTSKASFDGSADASIGVTGVLPIANGGTGGSTVATARTNLAVPGLKSDGTYVGLTLSEGDDSAWIRTTQNGIIPYKSGGYSQLGTTTWPFSSMTTQYLSINYKSNEGNIYLQAVTPYGTRAWSVTPSWRCSYNGGFCLHQYNYDTGNWQSAIDIDHDSNMRLDGKITAKNIDCGSVTATAPSGGGTSQVSVSFSKTFTSTPQVVAVAKTSVPGNCSCGITSSSTTGFTLNFYRNGNTATTVSWIAIGS